MKQKISILLLMITSMSLFYPMEDNHHAEHHTQEGIMTPGVRIQLKNGTKYPVYLNFNNSEPFIELEPGQVHQFNTDDIKIIAGIEPLQIGYVKPDITTVTRRWHPINLKYIEDTHWASEVEAVIQPGYRNNLWLDKCNQISDDFNKTTKNKEQERLETAQKWAIYLLENSDAKKFSRVQYATKEQLEAVYNKLADDINNGQWVDAPFTNLIRICFFEALCKALENIITPVEVELKNDTKYALIVKIDAKAAHELQPGESYTVNTQNMSDLKVGYKTPGFSIGLTNRWTEIDKEELEKSYRQQAVLMHLKPALNNDINISSIEKKGKFVSFDKEPLKIADEDFDYTVDTTLSK